MRILIVIAVLLIALVAGGLAVVSRLVAWDDYRDELIARAEAMTGQSVAIAGRIDLNLLPQPTLTLARTTLASPPDAVARMRLEVDRLDLELKPLPLLGGRIDVEEVRLIRPVLQVAPAADGRTELMQLAGAAAWLPLTPGGPSRVSVVDGSAVLPASTLGQIGHLEQVHLDLSTTDPGGAAELVGTFALNSQPFRIDARSGPPSEDRSSTLRLELVTDGLGEAGTTTLTFGGVVWWQADAPRLRGEVVLAGADARSAIGAVNKAVGQSIAPMPPWLAAPFRLTGRVGLEGDRVELSEIALRLDDTELNGRLRLIRAAVPEVDLKLEATRLGIPGTSAIDPSGGLAPFFMLASAVRGQVDLAVAELDYHGAAVRRLRASMLLSGDGRLRISDARAVLPGQTDVSFVGQLSGAAAETELRGTLTAVTQNLRGALAGFDLSPGGVPEGRLSSLSLASDVSVKPDGLRLRDLELRLDTTRVTGSVALDAAPRPQIAANLVLDRFDVDAYWPAQGPADLLARLAGPLDAAIEAQLARLTWRGVQLLDVGFRGRSVNGRLRIDELTVGDLAEAEARLTGEVDLMDGVFDLSGELSGIHAPRLLRRLGFEPSPLLARLEPLMVEGLASGSLKAADVELAVSDGSAKVELAGEVGWISQQAYYQLDLQAEHPDYRGLLRDLGAGSYAADGPPAPLTLAGTVQRAAGGASSVAGTAWLGATSITGKVAWQGEERPKIDARISVGEPTAAVLGGLLGLSGLRSEWPTAKGGFRGRWSGRPLPLPLLNSFDGDLVLSSKGGLAGAGLELQARLEQGQLTVEHASLQLWDGRLQGQLSFDVRRPLPYLVAAFDLKDFDPGGLADWLGVPPLLAGPAGLHVEATGAGDDVRTLVGSLMGEVELVAKNGPLATALPDDFAASSGAQAADRDAAPPAGIAASFALERGVLVVQPMTVGFGGIEARLEGVVDLFLWAVDLTLQAKEGAVLKVVGPLHRPQLRLITAARPEQASPAPSAGP